MLQTRLPVIDEVRQNQTPSPKLSGSYGGDRKQLFSRNVHNQDTNNQSTSNININRMHSHNNHPNMNTRRRSRSLSESGVRAAKKLSVPVNVTLVIFCSLWYFSSAMSNTLNKSILTDFNYPITLSMVQFLLVVVNALFTMFLAKIFPKFHQMLPKGFISSDGPRLARPNHEILRQTGPMGVFQLVGHILSYIATSMIPVSLVHTIKALSPLFTVSAYRIFFNIQYSQQTYLTLIPLTSGVALSCLTEFKAQFWGILFALASCMVFVSQNMYSKNFLTPESQSNKLDKLNMLCFVSSIAFLLTTPVWIYWEFVPIIKDYTYSRGLWSLTTSTPSLTGWSLVFAFLSNGFTHFFQNLMAFQVLGMVSPVTYSVASLLKRIVVILFAICWFDKHVSAIQLFGISLTFVGLYLYDKFGGDKTYTRVKNSTVLPK